MKRLFAVAIVSAVVCIGAGRGSSSSLRSHALAVDSVSIEIENSMPHGWQILYETKDGRKLVGMLEGHATMTFTAPAPLDTLRFWASAAPLSGMEDASYLVNKKEAKKRWNLG